MALFSGTGSDAASHRRSRVAYHTGRLLTYALIGLVFGLLGRGFQVAGWQRAVSVVAGVLLLVGGGRGLTPVARCLVGSVGELGEGLV